MKQIAMIVLVLAALAFAAQKNARQPQTVVHQTASGKFIQVGNTSYSSGIL
jgi:hypothetical protein